METAVLAKILNAIKSDDVKTFDRLITQKNLCLCLGRFPLLSLCYLYQSILILSKYESQLQSICEKDYIIDNEPLEIYADFKNVAGKSLRLFQNKIVSPIEMLAILGKSDKLNADWANLEKNEVLTANVCKIYQINYSADCKASEHSIKAPKIRGISGSADILNKMFIIALCFAIIFSCVFGLNFGLIGIGKTYSPLKIRSPEAFLKNSTSALILEKDLDLCGTYVDKAGSINGNNKKIFLDNLSFIETLEGDISNLTLIVNIDTETQSESSLIKTNNGSIQNVRVIINGTIKEIDSENDLTISSLVGENNGVIEWTTIEGNVKLLGNAKGNASYSAFASVNNGTIKNCKLENGSIISENVDIAGFVLENYGKIENVENSQLIKQTGVGELEDNHAWNPNCAGLVMTNYGEIENAVNKGEIQATSDTDKVFEIIVSGIATNNYGSISKSSNFGNISAYSMNCSAFAGGIASFNNATYSESDKLVKYAVLKECVNTGSVTISNSGNETSELISGGIASLNRGNVLKCDNDAKLTTTTNSAYVYSAGVVAINLPFTKDSLSAFSNVSECKSNTEIKAEIGNKLSLFGGIVARNQCYLQSSYAFAKFDIKSPEKEPTADENEGNEENKGNLQAYYAGSVAGLCYLSLNILGGFSSTTDNNYGYSEDTEMKAVGTFAYANPSTNEVSIISNVNDTLNSSFSDMETMIKTLKEKGLYRE